VRLNQRSQFWKAGGWIGVDLRGAGKFIDRGFDLREIIIVKLLIRPQSRAIQVLDADIVLFGNSNKRFDQRAGFCRLASHQFDDLRRRNAE